MGSVKILLFSTLLISLISRSQQQTNNAPYFLTELGGSSVDGALLNRLTKEGLLENTRVGTSVGILSCRDDDPGDVIAGYGVESQTLVVNQITGEVRVNRLLDRENYIAETQNKTSSEITRLLKPVFKCWDNRGLTASVEVDITLTDVNDNAPQFRNVPYQTEVDENTRVGMRIFNDISITDADAADNARMTVSCYEDPTDQETIVSCQTFSISTIQDGAGRYSSSLFLNQPLDYERRRGYTMTLIAKDLSKDPLNPPLNTSVNVLINVEDTQDTPPEFLNVPLTIYVRENVPEGTPVQLSISARDGDQGNPRPLSIRIRNDPQGLFRLGPSNQSRVDPSIYYANVIVNAPIDREQLQGTYEFFVEAVELENGTDTNSRTNSSVRVDILDENDNVPTFSQQVYNVSLYEIDSNDQSNFQIPDLNIQITDRDDPSNAQYRVVISSQTRDTFRVFPQDNVTGNVAVNLLVTDPSLLDYDNPSLRQQTVILEARELRATSTPRTSTATVSIQLQDLNDNSPVFTLSQYTYSQPENIPVGTTIATIQANDIDEGNNGRVTYHLSGTGSEQFSIDSTTGVITLANPLDFESNKVYQILMIARDAGNPPRETSRTLTIQVTNINDEGPVPVRTFYQTYAQETNLELRPAVIVQARDNEDPTSVITYSIIAGNSADGAFQVNRVTGELVLTKPLDFDGTPNRQGFYEIVIQASDNGNPAQYANMTVRVNVQDENNNTPLFIRSNYFARIGELAPEGTSVAIVSANDADKDENGRIRYTIQSGGREHFDIIETSGFISVSSKAQFDYNVFPEYRMIVYAIDYGSPPKTGTTTVVVEIDDANNKPPEFTQQIYVISISEATIVGSSVLNVTATDPDSTSVLRYSLPKSTVQARNSGGTVIQSLNSFDYRNAFVVNPITGEISTNRTLKRERAAEISFNVVVEDRNASTARQSATTSVLITILGTDVSEIFFTPARYYFSVTEGKNPGYVITTVAARDPACGNCLVTNYVEVAGTDSGGYLEVDRTSGRVSLSKAIDYEAPEGRRLFMEIDAIASDGRKARTNLVVEVRDDNDNSPQFRQIDYEFSVTESAQYPYRVGYVKATDKDSGSFGKVVYSLSGQGSRDFLIFESGLILVSLDARLDYETTKVYNLLVTASDNPTNQTSTVRKQTSVALRINILDINDNRPQFGTIYPFFVVENFVVGQSVGRIIATDGDAGTNGEIYFSMNDPSNLFRITNTGYILTQESLRERSPESPFIVTVRAEDRGSPSLYNETTVEINVRSGQLDDGKPQWSSPRLKNFTVYVDEGTSEEQFVITAKATARSTGPEVFYSLNTEGEDHKMFKIDRISGNITTNGTFDREDKEVYDLILIATDQHNNTLQSLRSLTVRVRDKDDNVPDFNKCQSQPLEPPMEVSISENTPIDTFVYKVKACDLDKEPYNQVIYRAEVGNEQCDREMAGGFFKISSDGNITTNRTLDRETKAHHLVCVRAFPVGGRRKRQADGFNRTEMRDPSHVAYVVISLVDVNDNGPIFPNETMHEAVQSVPEEKAVVRVEAIDPDLAPLNRVRYSIQRIIYSEPNYPSYALPGSFVIGSDTGIVSTNFPSYSDFRIPNSFFQITIQAEDFNDPERKDTMDLFVYIFEPSQTIRLIMDESPDKAREKATQLIRELSIADPSSMFKLQQVSYHRVVGQTDQFDVTRTDVCFVVVKNEKVLSVREGSNALSQKDLNAVIEKYGGRSPGSCLRTRSSLEKIDWQPLWWVLVVLAIFIFVCCCILIAAVYILHRNYKNYMKTRKTYLVPQ